MRISSGKLWGCIFAVLGAIAAFNGIWALFGMCLLFSAIWLFYVADNYDEK